MIMIKNNGNEYDNDDINDNSNAANYGTNITINPAIHRRTQAASCSPSAAAAGASKASKARRELA